MKSVGYPVYRSSGLDWMKEIPAHWEVKKLRYLGDALIGLTYDPADVVSEDEGTLVLRSSNIQNGRIALDDNVYVSTKIPAELISRDKDILICSRNGSRALVGKTAKIEGPAVGSSFGAFTTVFRSKLNDFLYYVFNSQLFTFQAGRFMTTTINQLTTGTLKDLEVPVPPAQEQRAIVDFLDRETARIDELLDEKNRLSDLLDHERRAVVSEAVLGGSGKSEPSIDSPLGPIPAHWSCAQLRRHVRMVTSGSRGWAEYYSEDGALFVRIGNLTRNSIRLDLTDIQRVTPPAGAEGERTRIRPGDVLFSITAYLGSVAVATQEAVGGYINQHIALVRVDPCKLLPEFLAYVGLSETGQSQLGGLGYGGTKIQLGLHDVRALWVPVPPLEEQRSIVNHLDRKLENLRALSERNRDAMTRIVEYRSTLISAAVTGQIDVRNYGPQEAAVLCQ